MSLAPSEFFTPAEFACHDGTPYPVEWADRWTLLVLKLCDPIRRMWGGPLEDVSGYRTPAWNAGLSEQGHNVASMSHHMEGRAADLRPRGGPTAVEQLHAMVLRAHAFGQLPNLGGLGLYEGWIHVDTAHAPDGHLRRWDMRVG